MNDEERAKIRKKELKDEIAWLKSELSSMHKALVEMRERLETQDKIIHHGILLVLRELHPEARIDVYQETEREPAAYYLGPGTQTIQVPGRICTNVVAEVKFPHSLQQARRAVWINGKLDEAEIL